MANIRVFRAGIITLMIAATAFLAFSASASSLADRLKGRILLQTESLGEAWYVRPDMGSRVYMGRPSDAFELMRSLGLGVSNADLNKIPVGFARNTTDEAESRDPDPFSIDRNFAQRLSGKILLQVQRNGEAWYVNPTDSHRYFLGRPPDAFKIMRELGLGITNRDLYDIPQAYAPHSVTSSLSAPPSEPQSDVADATWLPKPQKLSNPPHLFLQTNGEEITYYKTGTNEAGSDILLAEIPGDGPDPQNYHAYFLKEKGVYYFLSRISENYDTESGDVLGGVVDRNVKIDTTIFYPYFKAPDTLRYKDVTLNRGGDDPTLKTTRTQVATNDYGTLYSSDGLATIKPLHVSAFVLKTENGIEYTYQYNSEGLKLVDGIPGIRWSNGTWNADGYQQLATGGCGGGSFVPVLGDASLSDITEIGTSVSSSRAVYGFKVASNPVTRALYEMSGGAYYEKGESKKLTYDQFVTKHPVIMAKDALGRYVVYNNTRYGPAVECGKPVIYLYPATPTDVSVKVDAQIRISEPAYGNGWQVRAYPDGTLEHASGIYSSLFWEGTGKQYPTIARGFVVAKDQLENTLKTHLTQLGLNEKESSEFLSFWLPKMPQTPYTRLSWLGTREMNALAPLLVTPKPDTTIRIFLDFEGLNKPMTLRPQVLSSIPRNGFTLVEWGGLLRK